MRPWLLPAAMLLGSFAWSFVFVSLPFHIQEMGQAARLDPTVTLRWTGWILGISSLVTVVTGPLWGRLAGRGHVKRYYVAVESLQGLGFFGMAAARTLVELFFARVALGVMGAASTLAFMLAGRLADPASVRRQVAAIQSAMTVGQVLGPLAGAVAAARLGFRPSFVLGGALLLGCASLVLWGLRVPGGAGSAPRVSQRVDGREIAVAAAIVLAGSTQVFFLTSILPQILPALGVGPAEQVEVGGVVVFVSAVGAALGALATSRLAALGSERHVVATLLVSSSVAMVALSAMPSVWSFTATRFVQVLCIAPVFPLVVARIAQRASGVTIGLVNSARIGASFLGPVLATSTLAWGPPLVLYLVIAAGGLACVPLALASARPTPMAIEPSTPSAGGRA